VVARGAVPVEVREHPLLVPHELLDALGDLEQARIAAFGAEPARDLLDDRVARVADGVDRVPEADDDLLALDASANVASAFVAER
jgi:hypothetical protein